MIEKFNDTIDLWIKALDNYTFTQLYTKPSAKEWSIGQVYVHLIEDADYYISQIKIVSTNDNALESHRLWRKKCFGIMIFLTSD
jgi:hypothetical protein